MSKFPDTAVCKGCGQAYSGASELPFRTCRSCHVKAQTAAEWLDDYAKRQEEIPEQFRHPAITQLIAMLRDAKAELEKAQSAMSAFRGFDRPWRGWDAIETKWRNGDYK